MATKTISIKDEAYDRLAARKGEGESFSDVILRLTEDDPNDFSDLIGAGLELTWKDIEARRERTGADEHREALLRERREG